MIDLHTHSTASDGTLTPAELVAAGRAAGLTTMAITDHDTYAGWPAAAAAAAGSGVGLVRGVEISCLRDGLSIHLLGYLVDPDDPPLGAELAHARESRQTRLARMVDLLRADGIPVTEADVLAQVEGPSTTVGRPHIADALAARGVVRDRDEAFAEYLGNDSPYYVAHYAPDPVLAVELVRAAGGVPVIAHPFAVKRGTSVDARLIRELAGAGLVGIEAWHRDHTPEDRRRAERLATELGLFVTGSSDFHGTGKLNELGEHTTHPEVLQRIVALSSSGVEVVR